MPIIYFPLLLQVIFLVLIKDIQVLTYLLLTSIHTILEDEVSIEEVLIRVTLDRLSIKCVGPPVWIVCPRISDIRRLPNLSSCKNQFVIGGLRGTFLELLINHRNVSVIPVQMNR